MDTDAYEEIIIGGSYAGLSAALSLGRSLRKTLVIDDGKPCNAPAPHAHNFLTHDGTPPAEILQGAHEQLRPYRTVTFVAGRAIAAAAFDNKFFVGVADGPTYEARKLIFATGIRDLPPAIPGLAECWGKSVIHCPYCHGYEVRGRPTGILANGEAAYEYTRLIRQWTDTLTLFTNGPANLSEEQLTALARHGIPVIEEALLEVIADDGQVSELQVKGNRRYHLEVLYTRPPFQQQCDLPLSLGCTLNEHGYVIVDAAFRTGVPGVYACGDNVNMMRSLANAVYAGSMAGAMLNRDLVTEDFQ